MQQKENLHRGDVIELWHKQQAIILSGPYTARVNALTYYEALIGTEKSIIFWADCWHTSISTTMDVLTPMDSE